MLRYVARWRRRRSNHLPVKRLFLISHSLYLPILRHALPFGVALWCTTVAAAPVQDRGQYAEILAQLHREVALVFTLDAKLELDPPLRASAMALGDAHLAQVDRMLESWLNEEAAQQTETKAGRDLYTAVHARLLNELAMWQLDAGDAAYEEATLAVLKTARRVCVGNADWRFNDFSRKVARIQAMPAWRRDAALATERQLLARWDKARPAIPAMPEPLPQDAVATFIQRWQDGAPRPALALPPMLADALLSKRSAYAALDRDEQCGLHQWWLQLSLLQGATPAQVLYGFRYATLNTVTERYAGAYDDTGGGAMPPATRSGYPQLARRFSATGTSTVRVQLDSAQLPRQASIVERTLQVPGIRSARPIAFEQIFDAAALSHAMKGTSYPKPDNGDSVRYQLVWDLTAPDAEQDNQPKQTGKRATP